MMDLKYNFFIAHIYLKLKNIIMDQLITVVITLVVVGLILWLINRFIPMASSIKSILNVVVIIAVILWLLKVFGIWSGHIG